MGNNGKAALPGGGAGLPGGGTVVPTGGASVAGAGLPSDGASAAGAAVPGGDATGGEEAAGGGALVPGGGAGLLGGGASVAGVRAEVPGIDATGAEEVAGGGGASAAGATVPGDGALAAGVRTTVPGTDALGRLAGDVLWFSPMSTSLAEASQGGYIKEVIAEGSSGGLSSSTQLLSAKRKLAASNPSTAKRRRSPIVLPIVRSPGVRQIISQNALIMERSQVPGHMSPSAESPRARSLSPVARFVSSPSTILELDVENQPRESSQPTPHVVTHRSARAELLRMIVLQELPSSFVEHLGFRRFCASLNPYFRVVSRTTIKGDCLAAYQEQKLALLEVLVIHIQFKLIRLRAMMLICNYWDIKSFDISGKLPCEFYAIWVLRNFASSGAVPARSSRAGNADAARAVRNRAVCTPTVCLRVRFRAEEIELPLRRGAAAACVGSELLELPRSCGGGGGKESRDGEGDGDADAASGGEGRRRKEESGFHCSPPVDCAECSRGSG
ncbi:hypothetical protein OsJ_11333 [Oryza sativa Japonica Group]|uniref:Uncharacterized protein n=1 Tax=Oryza sativa subsp. japonica TaxID=39947 RepID=A3AJ96_ORYSJ|nr:hypothetical protein OsJ_11333 [Oryza sativa Japonica Group]